MRLFEIIAFESYCFRRQSYTRKLKKKISLKCNRMYRFQLDIFLVGGQLFCRGDAKMQSKKHKILSSHSFLVK